MTWMSDLHMGGRLLSKCIFVYMYIFLSLNLSMFYTVHKHLDRLYLQVKSVRYEVLDDNNYG